MTASNEPGPRAHDLGIPFPGNPGPLNAINDVSGVEVGFTTLTHGDGPLQIGVGPVRTGVTANLPRGKCFDPVFAGWFSLNGIGDIFWLFPPPIQAGSGAHTRQLIGAVPRMLSTQEA